MLRRAAALLLIAGASSCSQAAEGGRAAARPSVSIATPQVTAGQAVDLSYRFTVPADAPPFDEDALVFVHAVDGRGRHLWSGDHAPEPPTRRWTPGSVVEYTRPLRVPRGAEPGPVSIEVGLYSPRTGERVTLSGDDRGLRSYRVASLDVIAHPDPPPIFVDGWHGRESDGQAVEWYWSSGRGVVWLRNPRRDAVLVVDVDQPVLALGEPQRVTVDLGASEAATFSLAPGQREVRRIPVSAAQLGDDPIARVAIAPERTFVPARLPTGGSGDARELGVRVFSAYFEWP